MKKVKLLIITVLVLVLGCSTVLIGKGKVKVKADENDREFTNPELISTVKIDKVSKVQTESLYKLCKVWGMAKYYHPDVINCKVDWDIELINMIPKVMEAQDQRETNSILYEWLSKYSFEEKFTEKEYDEYVANLSKEDNEEGYTGFMLDMSWTKDTLYWGQDLRNYLVKLSHTEIKDRNNSAAYVDETGFINFSNEKEYNINPKDDGMKLLALFRFWNVYEYYSPNINITKKDWDEVLLEAIPKMLNVETYKDYVLTIAEVATETGDAHITVYDKENTIYNYYGNYMIPCSFKVIDDQIVVDSMYKTAKKEGLKVGDIISEIDGMNIKERVETLKRYSVVSEDNKYELKLSYSLLHTKNEKATVKVIRNNKEVNLKLTSLDKYYQKPNTQKNGLINQKMGYIDPSQLKEGDIEKLMKKFKSTEGIIVDLRNYPSEFIPYLLGEYIVPEPTKFVKFSQQHPSLPGCFYYTEAYTGAGIMKQMGDNRKFPAYNGKVMILMDESSMSCSEFTIMALRKSPNATVIGSPSIGADGNVVELKLPGKVSLNISGIGVYTPEGGQTQRVGLKPDVECYPTVKGLQEGRDELMEKARELILGK